jgi:hypothetical protein
VAIKVFLSYINYHAVAHHFLTHGHHGKIIRVEDRRVSFKSVVLFILFFNRYQLKAYHSEQTDKKIRTNGITNSQSGCKAMPN